MENYSKNKLFWKRLELFVKNVKVNDQISEEERQMILNVCNENIPLSDKMKEFIDKLDTLCFQYGYEIHPTKHGWTGKTKKGRFNTFAIIGKDEIAEITHIDGDGLGK